MLTPLLASLIAAAPTASLSVPSPAVAPAERPHHLAVNVGFAAPTGLVGVSYDLDLARVFQLGTGLGWGPLGVQLTALPRLLLRPSEPVAVFVGAGPSVSLPVLAPFNDQVLLWANAEAGVQIEGERLYAHIAGGAAVLVAGEIPDPFCALGCAPPERAGALMPNVRLAVGARF